MTYGPGPPMYYSPVDEFSKYHDFQKRLQEEQKLHDKKKEEKKARLFTFGEMFSCLLLASLPMGMFSSYLMINGIKIWVAAMSGMLK